MDSASAGVQNNLPTLFGKQLARDLEFWEAPRRRATIAVWKQPPDSYSMVSLLNILDLQGYRVSQKKAQIMNKQSSTSVKHAQKNNNKKKTVRGSPTT